MGTKEVFLFCSALFRSVPFRSVPFCSVPFRSVPFSSLPFRFCSGPFHSLPFHSVIFHSVPFCSIPFCPVLLCSALSHTLCSARVTRYVSLTVLRLSLCHRPNGSASYVPWAVVVQLIVHHISTKLSSVTNTWINHSQKRGFSISAHATVFFL